MRGFRIVVVPRSTESPRDALPGSVVLACFFLAVTGLALAAAGASYAAGGLERLIVTLTRAQLTGLITPTVILIGGSITFIGVITARRTACRRATIDMIEKAESTKFYYDAWEAFSKHRRAGTLMTLLDGKEAVGRAAERKQLEEDRASANNYLNHYEMMAIGIREGALDERIYREYMERALVRDWNAAAEWINRERWKFYQAAGWRYDAELYRHFGALALRWSPSATVIDRTSFGGPPTDAPAGPGDAPQVRDPDELEEGA